MPRPGESGSRDAVGKGGSVDQLHDERLYAGAIFEAVDRGDVQVIERGQDFGFALEASQPIAIRCQQLGKIFTATGRFSRVSVAR